MLLLLPTIVISLVLVAMSNALTVLSPPAADEECAVPKRRSILDSHLSRLSRLSAAIPMRRSRESIAAAAAAAASATSAASERLTPGKVAAAAAAAASAASAASERLTHGKNIRRTWYRGHEARKYQVDPRKLSPEQLASFNASETLDDLPHQSKPLDELSKGAARVRELLPHLDHAWKMPTPNHAVTTEQMDVAKPIFDVSAAPLRPM